MHVHYLMIMSTEHTHSIWGQIIEMYMYVQILYKTELIVGSVLVMILSSHYTVLPTSWLMLFIYS